MFGCLQGALRHGTRPEPHPCLRVMRVCLLVQDDHPLASLPLLGYSIQLPTAADGIQKDFVFKLQFKNHIYLFRAESQYTFERSVCRLSVSLSKHDCISGTCVFQLVIKVSWLLFGPDMELGHILWPSNPVTQESSDLETRLTRWPCSIMNSKCRLMCANRAF